MQYLAAALMLGGVLFWNGLWETGVLRRVLIAAALCAVFAALTSGIGLLACLIPPLAAWMVPALCGLTFAALCLALYDLAKRREQDELAAIFDGAATVAILLSALTPWLYLPGLSASPVAARWAHLAIALPGLALLSGITARRSDDARRNRSIHLTTLVLGSLSLYFGASDGSVAAQWRAVCAALGGAVMALIFSVAAAFIAPIRRIVSQNAGILAAATLLPLFGAGVWFSFAPSESSLLLAKAGVAGLLVAVWALIAGTRREPLFLYGAGLMTLLALWWGGHPLELWFDDRFHAVANPGRWFIYAAPLMALTGLWLRKRQGADSPVIIMRGRFSTPLSPPQDWADSRKSR